jgi:hypothetical protein
MLTRKYRIKQHYTEWYQNFGTQEMFVCGKWSSSDKTAESTAIPISSNASATTMGYGCTVPILSTASAATKGYECKNSILPLVLSFCA